MGCCSTYATAFRTAVGMAYRAIAVIVGSEEASDARQALIDAGWARTASAPKREPCRRRSTKPGFEPRNSSIFVCAKAGSDRPGSSEDTFPDTYTRRSSAVGEQRARVGQPFPLLRSRTVILSLKLRLDDLRALAFLDDADPRHRRGTQSLPTPPRDQTAVPGRHTPRLRVACCRTVGVRAKHPHGDRSRHDS
jgi:hypothetical protein